MKVQAIVAAGGAGARMSAGISKPLLVLGGVSLVARILGVLDKSPSVAGTVLVVPEAALPDFTQAVVGVEKPVRLVVGGATRSASVRAGLAVLDADTDIVLVHDAARPFLTRTLVDEGVDLAVRHGAAVAAVPLKSTVKTVGPDGCTVLGTPDRESLREVQTPQVFRRCLLERAHAGGDDATDDAALVEKLGAPVRLYAGDYRNIKITTPEDMCIAEALTTHQFNPRG